jgi:hypothetical protein
VADADRPEIKTHELDIFMSDLSEVPRRLKAVEALVVLRAAARATDALALLEDPALHPHLVVAAWRWARAAATAVGRCSDDETLDAALGDADPDPWTHRLVARPTPSQRALVRQGATSALYEAVAGEGISLLPPRDGRAARWCAAFESVAEDLSLRRAPRGPDCVRLLSDPEVAPLVAVGARHVVGLEDLLIDQAQRVLFRHGERGVMDHFRDRYGLSRRECLGLVRLARADALQYGRSSVEDDRALMVALLKDYTDRAREAFNLDGEMKGLRELARVQGLTRTEPEDKMSEFLGVVRRVSGRRDALSLVGAAAEAVEAEPEDVSEELGSLPTDADAPLDVTFRVTEKATLARFDAEDARQRQEEEVG